MITTRRFNDPPRADEGLRVLVCRYRPRGVRVADETWDVWWPDLGPSVELHAAYYGKHGRRPIGWEVYRERYLAEMAGARPQALIAELAARVARGDAVALLCSSACTDAGRCHRTLLAELVAQAAAGRA